MKRSFKILVLVCWIGVIGLADTTTLEESVKSVAANFRGRMALAAKNLETGETVQFQGDQTVQTASVIKLPIMVEVFYQVNEGKLKLEDPVTFAESDKVDGSGILRDLHGGLNLTLLDAVTLMIVLSDNLATNLVIDKVGIESVNKRMVSLGLKNTRLFKKVFIAAKEPVSEEAKKFGLGMTTPLDMLSLLEKIATGKVVDPAACDRMISILKKQRYRDEIPRYLDQLSTKEKKVSVANKTGALNDVRNDVAIVYAPHGKYLLSVFCYDTKDTRWTADNEATLAIAHVARIIVEHFEKHDNAKPMQQ